jgi:hypothetical protein
VFRRALSGLALSAFGLLFFMMSNYIIGPPVLLKGLIANFVSWLPNDPESRFLLLGASDLNVFSLLIILFPLIGVSLMLTPLWVALAARRTLYAVTSRRALILKTGFLGGLKVRSFDAKDLEQIDKYERPDGSGSLMFSSELYTTTSTASSGYSGTVSNVRTRRVGFDDVPDVAAAEQAIRQLVSRPSS